MNSIMLRFNAILLGFNAIALRLRLGKLPLECSNPAQ